MTKSSRLFLFPDINVWVALSYDRHIHHPIARRWFEGERTSARFFFCRFTQLGLLRLLTSEAVMGADLMSQREAWKAYDRWLEDERVEILQEPDGIEPRFRTLSGSVHAVTKDWADSYLAAFALSAGLTIVTFDTALHRKSITATLLKN
jgi:hypothetical protein